MIDERYKKILIVGSLPFRLDAQSRAFDSYFHNWPHDKLRQIFFSPKDPLKGHCEQFFQITDYRMLKRHFDKNVVVGRIFKEEDLKEQGYEDSSIGISQDRFYKLGKRKTPLKRFLRKWIWKERYWRSPALKSWIDDFAPEAIFLAWSDDFYTLRIALSIAKERKIPIISCIGDDYYFNEKFSLNPLYHLYRIQYKRLFRNVLKYAGTQIYIDDKIKTKYNDYFNLDGYTVHVGNENEIVPLNIPKKVDSFVYIGNLEYHRYDTLAVFSKIMAKENPNYHLSIYSPSLSKKALRKLTKQRSIECCGKIPYKDIKNKISEFDAILIVESLANKKDIKSVRYSLSTKAADSLSYGKPVIAVGNKDCGVIDYLMRKGCAIVLNSTKAIESFAKSQLTIDWLSIRDKAISCLSDDFKKEANVERFEKIVRSLDSGK